MTFFNSKKKSFDVTLPLHNINFNIKNNNKKFCYAYSLIIIKDIDNTLETSDEIKETLIHNKIPLINFIVDILNYVTLVTGYPLHAYDYDAISNNLIIDKLQKEETFFTVNKNEIKLKKNSLIIRDEKNNILSIPGIIGSDTSKIKNTTKNILIENAIFNKHFIEKLSKTYKIKTKASEIFSKGANINNRNMANNLLLSILNPKDITYFEKFYKDLKLIKKNINLYKKNILNMLGFFITDDIIEIKILVLKF